jgi:FlaA1/EpsC-like NDP-sugar epimerase
MQKILVFGGTGSLGYEITKRYIDTHIIYNYSRDECKHWNMKLHFNNHPNLHFIIGDVINRDTLKTSILRVDPDIIIIASAMKHVDQCEINNSQCINTNLLGVQGILNIIETHQSSLKLHTTLFVSTDKACSPINTYGMTKALSEQLMNEKAYYLKDIKFINIRYGNVLNSRGSIIPLLHKIGKDPAKTHFTITDIKMTRFVMTLQQSVDLIDHAILHGVNGDTIVPTLISMKINDLLCIFSELYNKPIVCIGKRPGERMCESLINETQSERIVKNNTYFHIKNNITFDQKNHVQVVEIKNYDSTLNPLSKTELYDFITQLKLI